MTPLNTRYKRYHHCNGEALAIKLQNQAGKERYIKLSFEKCDLSDPIHLFRVAEEICKFINVKALEFINCRITQFPEAILQLKKICYLNFEDNQLTEIPRAAAEHENQLGLALRGNPIPFYDPEVVRRCNFYGRPSLIPLLPARNQRFLKRAYRAFPPAKTCFQTLAERCAIVAKAKDLNCAQIPAIIHENLLNRVINCPLCQKEWAVQNGSSKILLKDVKPFLSKSRDGPFDQSSSIAGIVLYLGDGCASCCRKALLQKQKVLEKE